MIKTTAAYRSNEGGYKFILANGKRYKDVFKVRAILTDNYTQLEYITRPIGGFTYEGEMEFITYEGDLDESLIKHLHVEEIQ